MSWGETGPSLGDMIIANSQPVPPTPVVEPPPLALPTESAGAAMRLKEIQSTPEWRDKWLAGGVREQREYRELMATIEKGGNPEVDAAMAGLVEDAPFQPPGRREMIATAEMLRDLGIGDGVVREALEGRSFTQAEHNLAVARKAERMRDHDWVQKFLAGNVDQSKEMMTLNIILAGPIAKE